MIESGAPQAERQPDQILHAQFMNLGYSVHMSTEIIQVRDVPADDAEALRVRAASRGMSLSSYLRELIHDDTSRPAMVDVLARIGARSRVEASSEDIRSFIENDRR